MKTKVMVAIYDHQDGMDTRAFDSWKKAQAWKDEIGADKWARVSDDPQPEDPCGDEYFDLVDDEWFNVEECEVE